MIFSSKSFAESARSISLFVSTHSEIIKIVSLVCAGVFVLVEYLDHQKSNREVHALEYVYRAHNPTLLEARIDTEIVPTDPPLDRYTKNSWQEDQDCSMYSGGFLCPPIEEVLLQQRSYIKDDENSDFRRQTHRVAAFYGAISMCALSEKCDPEILCVFFSGEVWTFYMRHYGYLNELQKSWYISRAHYIERFLELCEEGGHRY